MSRRCHISLLLILSTFLITATGCGRHDSDEKYFLVTANVQLPYWQEAKAGFMQASEQLRVQAAVVGPDSYDPKAELAAFDDAVKKKPAGILISVADPAVLMYSINNAIAAGIPVITIDADAPVSKRLFFVGTNNYQAGLLGGKRLAEELKDKGNVVFFTMPSNSRFISATDCSERGPSKSRTMVIPSADAEATNRAQMASRRIRGQPRTSIASLASLCRTGFEDQLPK